LPLETPLSAPPGSRIAARQGNLGFMATVAELAGVTVRRGTSVLLDNIDLVIEEGQRWVVVGPNGAGKTTMLQLLAAQSHPTSGVVSLLGEYLGAVDIFELRPRIGVSSASITHRIPPREKVSDVVISSAYGVVGRWREQYDQIDEARALNLMQQLRVAELADRTFGTLSEGERKRTEIARALMTDPELLLLDEPGAGLDLAGREILVDTLKRLCEDPDAPTMVLVTHHLEEMPAGLTHALLLDHGKVIARGPIEKVITDENMSRAYGLPLRVTHEDGRWHARAVLPGEEDQPAARRAL